MDKITHYLFYIPLLALVYVYAIHAAGVFMPDEYEEYTEIVSSLGFATSLTTILVWAVLPLDGLVALLLLFGNKVSASFPWGILFLWATLWPWVPRAISFNASMDPEAVEGLIVSLIALLAYFLYKKKDAVFFSK